MAVKSGCKRWLFTEGFSFSHTMRARPYLCSLDFAILASEFRSITFYAVVVTMFHNLQPKVSAQKKYF